MFVYQNNRHDPGIDGDDNSHVVSPRVTRATVQSRWMLQAAGAHLSSHSITAPHTQQLSATVMSVSMDAAGDVSLNGCCRLLVNSCLHIASLHHIHNSSVLQ